MATVLTVSIAAASDWRASGSGNAASKADKAKSLVVTTATPVSLLYPGGSGDAALRITNPNPWVVTVRSIVGNGTVTTTAAGCDASVVTFTDQGGSWAVPKKSGSTDGTLDVLLAGAVAMADTAADECQDATFMIPVTASTDPLVGYVVVGYNGTILTSTDGSSWTARASDTTQHLTDVAFGGGKWVAVGFGGAITTSSDGVTWTASHWSPPYVWNDVRHNGSMWVVGGSGGLLSSPDATTWTARSSGVSAGVQALSWNPVAQKWLALAGYSNGTENTPVWSTDALTWTPATSFASSLISELIWAGNQWVATGYLTYMGRGAAFFSPDGTTWTSRFVTVASGTWLGGIAWNGTRLVVADGYDAYWSSNNGLSWTTVAGVPSKHVTWAGGQWLASTSTTGIRTSPDAVTWTTRAVPTTQILSEVAGR